MFEIVKTIPGDENFSFFLNFPKEIYPENSLSLKVIEGINTEYLVSCYLLTLNGEIRCRAALYNNPYLLYQGKKTYTIGNYESKDNSELAFKLLKYITADAMKDGVEYLIGPMNGSTWDNYRFSTHHSHPHFFLEPYNHLYYNKHFLNSGFEAIARYFSSLETDLKVDLPSVLQKELEFKQAGLTFRNINLDEYECELEMIYRFNEIAFKSNFLYTPISFDDFIGKYLLTKRFIEPQFVVLAEDAEKNLIGYFFCITDVNNTASKTLIAKTVARHPDKKWSGMGHVLGNIICKRAQAQEYQSIIHAFMYDEGTSLNMSKNFSGKTYKNYVLFGKAL